MRLVIISGVSGSGKSVALHVLEDLGFYCIDNIPVPLLKPFVDEIVPRNDPAFENVGIGLDARSRPSDLAEVPTLVHKLRDDGLACEIIFLQTDNKVLLSRFSETRRKHPLSDDKTSLEEAIAKERELLSPIINSAELVIDTTRMSVYALREQIRERVAPRTPGVGVDHDRVVRLQERPAGERRLRVRRALPAEPVLGAAASALERQGRSPSAQFLDAAPMVQRMVDDIAAFLEEWIPRYQDFQRSYLTVAIGCTGGMHRSVYVAEAVAKRLAAKHGNIRTHHSEVR